MATKKGGRPAKCYCGCGTVLKPRRKFTQGHDARFKGNALKVARKQATMTETTKGMPEKGLVEFRQLVSEHRQTAQTA